MGGALIVNRSPVTLGDVTPIARLTAEAGVVVVPVASPIQNINDLAAALKKDPVKVSWAGGLAGGIDHVIAALIAKAVGVDIFPTYNEGNTPAVTSDDLPEPDGPIT